MKIAYFGSDMFHDCLRALVDDRKHQVIGLYTGEKDENDAVYTRHVRHLAEAHKIPTIKDKPNAETMATLHKQGCEMVLCAGYNYKIPAWEGGAIRYGVNIHPSLLPQGGGPISIPLAIYKGLDKTGVTMHVLANDWDAGDIVLQTELPIGNDEVYESLLNRVREAGKNVLIKFLQSPQAHWDAAMPQDPSRVEYWPMPKIDLFANDYTEDMEIVRRKLRVHRFISPEGNVEYIDDIALLAETHDYPAGTVINRSQDHQFTVAVKDGFIQFQVKTYIDNVKI